MYRVYRHKISAVFVAMFKRNSDIHGHNTRQSQHFHLLKPKKEIRKLNVCYRGAVIWNNILSLDINIHVNRDVELIPQITSKLRVKIHFKTKHIFRLPMS